jgi:hypothetical protein
LTVAGITPALTSSTPRQHELPHGELAGEATS